ncbi:MAG: carbohydrate kinase family protein [bacterium]|nr:carbohydrate kinase family protein [bacterium]
MYDIITIGTATRDAFIESPSFVLRKERKFSTGQALSMPAGAKIDVSRIIFTTGGGATNAAVTFARQGLKTACIAKVGSDVSGEEVRSGLLGEHVDARFLLKTKKYSTAYSLLLLSGGERTILVYRGASERLLPEDIAWEELKTRWFFLFPGGAFKTCEKALRYARAHGIRTALNPSLPMLKRGAAYFRSMLRQVDVLIMNREEASMITGIPYRKHEAIFKKIDEWMPCLAVLTDGAHGAMVSDGANLYTAGVFREKQLVNRTGAGDAFGSGFVAGLIQGTRNKEQGARKKKAAVCDIYPPDVIKYAMRLGSANATSVVEHFGAKAGILGRREFTSPRWRNFAVSRSRI